MIIDITPTEIDIQIAGTALYDYFRDLMQLSGHTVSFDEKYKRTRIAFGDACVEMKRAIEFDLNKNK